MKILRSLIKVPNINLSDSFYIQHEYARKHYVLQIVLSAQRVFCNDQHMMQFRIDEIMALGKHQRGKLKCGGDLIEH